MALGDFCEFAYGKSLTAKTRSGDGYPVYGSNGQVGLHDTALTAGATIVIGRKGSFGEVHYSPGPCSPIDTTYYVPSEQTTACLPWLARRLLCLGLDQLNRAAAVSGLNRTDVYRQRLLKRDRPEFGAPTAAPVSPIGNTPERPPNARSFAPCGLYPDAGERLHLGAVQHEAGYDQLVVAVAS